MLNCLIKFFLCLGLVSIIGCNTTTRKFDPDVMVELRGAIRPEKSVYNLGEQISVNYILTNASSQEEIQEEVIDGSSKKEVAFTGYDFNAISENDQNKHLELKEAGTAFKGTLKLSPNQEQIFCQNIFHASQPGNYLLSFDLRWKNGKRISFKPITIRVLGQEVILTQSSQNEELKTAIKDLASSDPKIKLLAREKIKEYGAEAAKMLIPMLGETDEISKEATTSLIDIGKPALPALLSGTKDYNNQIRMRSVYILGQIGDPAAFPALNFALLNDPNVEVRRVSLRIIAENLANEIAIPLLIQALSDSDVSLRTEANSFLTRRASYDLGFSATASLEERKNVIEAWKEWWQKKSPQPEK